MSYLFQELFFFTSQAHKLAVWLAQLKAKFFFNQAREHYANNLKKPAWYSKYYSAASPPTAKFAP